QQTLRALIDWSYDLLDERERMVFRRLSIFVDGFTVEAVGPVVADADIDEFDAFELLASLVDKSLVLAEPVGDAMRYRMLESTSAYARERLIEAGERERIAERHVHYVRDRFIAAAEAWNVSGRSSDVSGALATELGNVRAALDAALAGLDRVAGAETLAAIDHVWNDIGLEREGRMRTEAFLDRLGDDDAHVVARLSVVLARSAGSFRQGSQAVEFARLAVERARSAGDAAMLNEALIVYSWNAAAAERFAESEAAMHEAEGIPVTSVRLRLSMLNTRAYLSYHASDFVTAAHLFGRLRDEHRALRNPSREREAMLALAEVEYNLGHTQRAIDTVTEILRGVEKGRYRVFRGSLLSNLAGYMVSIEDCVGAAAAARDAIEELGAHEPNSASVINAMQHLALTLALGSDTSRAATLAGYVEAASERFGYRRELNELASRDRLVAVLQDKVGSDDLGRMLGEGAAMDSETAIEFALRAE
ncbi:MAG: hypothetical protein IAI50_00840, partial [Candidatus Eremiobacteraeota bacterium]|nr:hypothetical protein [Candidatus Eremiobacteraeota bacterium]